MLFPKAVLIAACYFSTSVLGSTLPSSTEGQPLPDKSVQMSLNETIAADTRVIAENMESGLVERTPVRASERPVATTASYVVITNFVIQFAKSLASSIKELSDQGSCNSMSGTYQGLKWTYHSTDRNCDTTAQYATIDGAIKKYLANIEHNNLSSTQCLRLDHSGAWDGWLKLGPIRGFDDDAYRGPTLSSQSCLDGDNEI